MNHYTFLHGADLHLGGAGASTVLPRSIRTRLKQESWESFARIVQTCRERGVDFLFLSGDIFDHDRIRMTDLKAMASTFETLEHTRVFIAPGNHDPVGGRLSYDAVDWPANVTVFREEALTEVPINDWLSIWGFAWKNNSLDLKRIRMDGDLNLLKTNILLIHGDWDAVESDYLPLKPYASLLERFDYVALGHIHKPSIDGGKIVYSGAPYASSFKDQGLRGTLRGHIQKGRVTHEFVPMNHIRFEEKTVEVEGADTWQDIRRKILAVNEGEQIVCRVTVEGIKDPDLNLDDLKTTLEDAFLYLELVDDTIPDYDIERLYQEHQDNIIGQFVKSMLQEDLQDPVQRLALFYGLDALLQGRES